MWQALADDTRIRAVAGTATLMPPAPELWERIVRLLERDEAERVDRVLRPACHTVVPVLHGSAHVCVRRPALFAVGRAGGGERASVAAQHAVSARAAPRDAGPRGRDDGARGRARALAAGHGRRGFARAASRCHRGEHPPRPETPRRRAAREARRCAAFEAHAGRRRQARRLTQRERAACYNAPASLACHGPGGVHGVPGVGAVGRHRVGRAGDVGARGRRRAGRLGRGRLGAAGPRGCSRYGRRRQWPPTDCAACPAPGATVLCRRDGWYGGRRSEKTCRARAILTTRRIGSRSRCDLVQ